MSPDRRIDSLGQSIHATRASEHQQRSLVPEVERKLVTLERSDHTAR